MACNHVSHLSFDASGLFPDHPRVAWCTSCGSLLDAKTDEPIAEPTGIDEDRISGAYLRLAELAGLLPEHPDLKPEYDGTLADLRSMQAVEAEALRRIGRAGRHLDPDKFREAVANAEAFLATHGCAHCGAAPGEPCDRSYDGSSGSDTHERVLRRKTQ